ncbi:hypothetical protein DM02DRAFT_706007 [Periconia macrospinosa]|uniref:Uncharacterized protein n=1 Tax=Periconia macrospinosa TaxID=97972 RepID=A0A2V1CZT0_9PLEO|nr:hypothetical protein DM02DRAFT_706007 [Periconia macrospinosa]
MPYLKETGPFRSAFSIIQLEFKVPFTSSGPPKFLSEIWAQCLQDIRTEEHWYWTRWSQELDAPNKVFIVIGWNMELWRRPGDSRDDMTGFQLAIARLKAKGMPRAIDSLSEFLTASPDINCILAPQQIQYTTTICDVLLVRTPSSGSLYEEVDAALEEFREFFYYFFCQRVVCRKPYAPDARGDIVAKVFGVDIRPGTEEYGNGVCTFVFFIYWDSAEAMQRFKDPGQESFRKCKEKIDQDWWTREFLGRVEKFKDGGACVSTRTLDFSVCRLWPFVPGSSGWSKSRDDKMRSMKDRFLNVFCGK